MITAACSPKTAPEPVVAPAPPAEVSRPPAAASDGTAVRRAPAAEKPAPEVSPSPRPLLEGLASYYGPRFHGRLTANGERFDRHGLTAAHRKLAFGTCLDVTNVANGKSVRVRINDRGPFVHGRVLDVSEGAARKLGMLQSGVARVRAFPCPRADGAKRTHARREQP